MVAARAGGRRMVSCLMSREFVLYYVKKVMEINGGDGCTTL
jgi:hypothetical protein